MNYLAATFMENRKSSKFKLLAILFLLFSGVNIIGTLHQSRSFLLEDVSSNRQVVNTILSDFQDLGNPNNVQTEHPLYANLHEQSSLLARLEQTILFESWDSYLTSSLELIDTRLEFLDIPDSENYQTYFPTKNENLLDKAFINELVKSGQPVYTENSQIILALLSFLFFLGILWFPLNAVMSSDILLSDMQHLSVSKGFPISFSTRVLIKTFFQTMLTLASFLVVLLLSVFLSLFYSFGQLNYPVSVYLFDFQTVPFWQYSLLVLLYFSLVSVFACILSLLFNYLFRNMYLTLFASLGVYLPAFFLTGYENYTWILPSNFLNPVALLHAEHVTQGFFGSYFNGILVLLIWIGIMIVFLSRRLSLGIVKRGGN